MAKNQVILVISDLHIPYEHRDALAFLRAVKAKYKPTQVICIGDEVDMAVDLFKAHIKKINNHISRGV
jgi:predicted phosphodiesterase